MGNQRIATTRLQDFQPLATAGQTAIEAWRVLQLLLLRELSPAHARLLSEPVTNEARGEIDWYAEGSGPATLLADLPEPERTAAKARLDGLCDEVRTLAVRLAASRANDERFLSELLGLAMQPPGPDCVYMQDDSPVLAGWGQRRIDGLDSQTTLTGLAKPKPPAVAHAAILLPPPSPYAAAPAYGTWLRTALGASLLALLLAFVLLQQDPFGWFVLEVPQCRLDQGELDLARDMQEGVAREGVLRAELARLTVDAGGRRLLCPPQARPVSLPGTGDAERAHGQGGQTGKLQVILAWDDQNDLDLLIVCPNGTDINFVRHQACGGTLDVDANSDPQQLTASPVENVFFADPLPGAYRVVVDPYGMHEHPETPFRVTIRREGQPDLVVTGLAKQDSRYQTVTQFSLERP
jgi:hypothetical protein